MCQASGFRAIELLRFFLFSQEARVLINTIYTQFFHVLVILNLYTSQRFRRYEMKKPFMAVLIALLVTACVGVSIFAIGGAALVNKNGVTPSNSPAQASNASTVNSSQVDQLQALVSQYKDREQQYQQREGQLQQQLAAANTQIQEDRQTLQQVQMLLGALQQRGLIRLTNDGRIVITQ